MMSRGAVIKHIIEIVIPVVEMRRAVIRCFEYKYILIVMLRKVGRLLHDKSIASYFSDGLDASDWDHPYDKM